MREIIFRGKPTKEVLEDESLIKTLSIKGGFVYGNLIYNDKQPYIVGPIADANDEYCSMEWWCPVVKETVGQFTGFKDKHGRKIFEGDLYTAYGSNVYEIRFVNGSFCGGVFDGDDSMFSPLGWESPDDDEDLYIDDELFKIMEVIGNIHDNPELLEDPNAR